jgi:hypothetical protein
MNTMSRRAPGSMRMIPRLASRSSSDPVVTTPLRVFPLCKIA